MVQDGKPIPETSLDTSDWRLLQNNECVEQIDLLIRAAHLVRATLNNTFAQLDINEVRYSALKVIRAVHETGCSQSELARKLGQSESNICTLIERMESDQLVIRQQSQKDRRKRVLRVTDQGLNLLDQIKACHGTVSRRLLTSLSSDQRRQLTGILQAILKSAYTQRSQRETVKTFSDVSSPSPFQEYPAA